MRIKVKWTSCGHRKKMALICFYVYADGYRQSVGYLCRDCLTAPDPLVYTMWIEASTWKVHIARALPLRELGGTDVGEVVVVFARVIGAEDVLPDERLQAIATELEARKLEVAERIIAGPRQAGMQTPTAEAVAQGITFAVESGAVPADYKR